MTKNCVLIVFYSFFYVSLKAQTTYFNQDFNNGNNLSAYVASPPATNQFDTSLINGSGSTIGIINNKLELTRTGGSGGASITRYTNLGMPIKGVFQVSFDFDCAASTGSNGTTYFTIGNLISTDATSVGVPSDANSLLKLRMVSDNTSSGNFYVQNIIAGGTDGRAPAVGFYSGVKKIIAVLNNSNCSSIYTGPNLTSDTLASLTMDLYVNNVLVINDAALEQSSSTISITGFKLNVSSNNAISHFDNIVT